MHTEDVDRLTFALRPILLLLMDLYQKQHNESSVFVGLARVRGTAPRCDLHKG